MSCTPWHSVLAETSLDELPSAQRQEFLAHLQSCASCRRAAAEVDPTVVFSLLPSASVEENEVEEIRRTVGALRRVRALESTWVRRAQRGLVAAGALAVLAAVAVLLIPRGGEQGSPTEIPFAGAVGVGSGLVTIPESSTPPLPVDLHVELARSAKVLDLAAAPPLQKISEVEWMAVAGEIVDRELGSGYRLRFALREVMPAGGMILEDLQLLRQDTQGWVSLLDADLQPLGSSQLILAVDPGEGGDDQMWLLLAGSIRERRATLRASQEN